MLRAVKLGECYGPAAACAHDSDKCFRLSEWNQGIVSTMQYKHRRGIGSRQCERGSSVPGGRIVRVSARHNFFLQEIDEWALIRERSDAVNKIKPAIKRHDADETRIDGLEVWLISRVIWRQCGERGQMTASRTAAGDDEIWICAVLS